MKKLVFVFVGLITVAVLSAAWNMHWLVTVLYTTGALLFAVVITRYRKITKSSRP